VCGLLRYIVPDHRPLLQIFKAMKTEYESVKDGDEQAAFEAVKAVRVIKGTRRVSRR
jgi:hypothetical protein